MQRSAASRRGGGAGAQRRGASKARTDLTAACCAPSGSKPTPPRRRACQRSSGCTAPWAPTSHSSPRWCQRGVATSLSIHRRPGTWPRMVRVVRSGGRVSLDFVEWVRTEVAAREVPFGFLPPATVTKWDIGPEAIAVLTNLLSAPDAFRLVCALGLGLISSSIYHASIQLGNKTAPRMIGHLWQEQAARGGCRTVLRATEMDYADGAPLPHRSAASVGPRSGGRTVTESPLAEP